MDKIKAISTTTINNRVVTTIVSEDNRIFSDIGPKNTWIEKSKQIHQEVLEPIDVVEVKEFDVSSLKRAYIQGIISSQDLHAKNPYPPTKDEFKVWLEGRAYAMTA